jgi:hypothetical protein
MLEFLSGVVVGAGALYLLAQWFIKRLIAKVQAEVDTRETDLVIRAAVEQHNGVYYFYNEKNNEFLVQGKNLQELLDHLESRRPGTTVHVVRGDDAVIAQLKAMAK